MLDQDLTLLLNLLQEKARFMNFHSLNTAISIGAVLSSLGEDKETVSYDALKSAITGIDYETTLDAVECCDTDSTIVSYLSFMGVRDAVIEDMVSSRVNVSEDAIFAISQAFATQYNDNDLEELSEEFAKKYESLTPLVELDGISPPKCKSGYKRKPIMKHGRQDWKCVKMFGRVRLSAKQKQGLRKARLKSHSASANYSRKRSVKMGKTKGLY